MSKVEFIKSGCNQCHCSDFLVSSTNIYFLEYIKINHFLESRLDSGMKLEGGPSELSAKIKLDFTKGAHKKKSQIISCRLI